ncbi:MAG: hypothetical protein F9K44_07655 [Hyphomicrobiaceae bacterium]|nr:MAG: hypothetical protein F9K44_07655 [Hyphomicrobiaceae bacterium]
MRAVAAGAGYFASGFALGFILGVLRVTILAPSLGKHGAVLAELPVILAFSWWAAGWMAGRLGVPSKPGPRLVMGAVAFALLMGAETALAVFLLNEPLAAHFGRYGQSHELIGLAGQIAFAVFPLLRR